MHMPARVKSADGLGVVTLPLPTSAAGNRTGAFVVAGAGGLVGGQVGDSIKLALLYAGKYIRSCLTKSQRIVQSSGKTLETNRLVA